MNPPPFLPALVPVVGVGPSSCQLPTVAIQLSKDTGGRGALHVAVRSTSGSWSLDGAARDRSPVVVLVRYVQPGRFVSMAGAIFDHRKLFSNKSWETTSPLIFPNLVPASSPRTING